MTAIMKWVKIGIIRRNLYRMLQKMKEKRHITPSQSLLNFIHSKKSWKKLIEFSLKMHFLIHKHPICTLI
jgi:hypothetical protein